MVICTIPLSIILFAGSKLVDSWNSKFDNLFGVWKIVLVEGHFRRHFSAVENAIENLVFNSI